jgi:putative glutamine amidotransferase
MAIAEKKPVIGVLPLVDEQRDSFWMLPGYMEGILGAGGIPVMLPLTQDPKALKQLTETMDGFLFTGGQDIDPGLYGEDKLPVCGNCCEARDKMEKALLDLVLRLDKPVLGICRGIQLLNAVYGGTLYQDLPAQHPSQVEHHQAPPYEVPAHEVQIRMGTPLARLLGQERIAVNSYHHQAIKELGTGLQTMARADDGLIEAVWAPDKKYVWAFQWHPEFSYKAEEGSRKIFSCFVQNC